MFLLGKNGLALHAGLVLPPMTDGSSLVYSLIVLRSIYFWFWGSRPPAEVGDRDDGDERAEVVGPRDDAALRRVVAEASLDRRDDDVGEDHALIRGSF